jgi:hypothetical protein
MGLASQDPKPWTFYVKGMPMGIQEIKSMIKKTKNQKVKTLT